MLFTRLQDVKRRCKAFEGDERKLAVIYDGLYPKQRTGLVGNLWMACDLGLPTGRLFLILFRCGKQLKRFPFVDRRRMEGRVKADYILVIFVKHYD